MNAGIDPPLEVTKFFNGEPPDEKGVVVDIEKSDGCYSSYSTGDQDWFEIDLEKIPDGVQIIRFVNSY
jgi:hypothetical protein